LVHSGRAKITRTGKSRAVPSWESKDSRETRKRNLCQIL